MGGKDLAKDAGKIEKDIINKVDEVGHEFVEKSVEVGQEIVEKTVDEGSKIVKTVENVLHQEDFSKIDNYNLIIIFIPVFIKVLFKSSSYFFVTKNLLTPLFFKNIKIHWKFAKNY